MNPKLFKSFPLPTKEKDMFLECCELLLEEGVQWLTHIKHSNNLDNLFKHRKQV